MSMDLFFISDGLELDSFDPYMICDEFELDLRLVVTRLSTDIICV